VVTKAFGGFHTGGALDAEDPYYVDRGADVEAVNTARHQKFLYTTAPRQMGKTSLVKRLAARMSGWGWKCCFTDLATMKGLDKEKWFSHLGVSMARQLECSEPQLRDQLDFRSFLMQTCGLDRAHQPAKIALCFDEVEGLMGYTFSDEFLMVLRDLYQTRGSYPGSLFVAFAGAVDTDVLVKDPAISPFNVAEKIVVENFSTQEARRLTTRLEDAGVSVDDSAHDRIVRWTAGHPHLTQRICELLADRVALRLIERIGAKEVDEVVRDRILNPRLMDTNVKHVAAATGGLKGPAASLWQSVLARKTVTSFTAGFDALYLTGAVVETQEHHLQIRNRIYEEALLPSSTRGGANVSSTLQSEADTTSVGSEVSAPLVREPLALVMKGGSVKGLAYVGALKELVKHYQFDWFIGTSAGAIAAVLLAAGYTPERLEALLSQKDFRDFLDARPHRWPLNFLIHRGLFPADALTDWVDELLAKELGSADRVRLEDLPRRVTVYAARRDDDARTFDSHDMSERQKFASFAVRCSMAIPFVFMPQREEGLRVLDGGMRNNYPIETLLKRNPGTKFLGLYLGSPIYEGRAKRDRTGSLVGDLLSIWTESPDLKALRAYREQTIIIDPRPITTLSFRMTDDEKRFLVQVGRAAALRYLADQSTTNGAIGITKQEALAAQEAVERERRRLVGVRARRRRKRIGVGAALAVLIVILAAIGWMRL
jgi:predicted acylesterase/phospholipase RssA